MFAEVFGEGAALPSIGRVGLPETPSEARRTAFAVRPHELDPYAHANNAVYLDWLEEALLGDPDPAGRAAVEAWPRRYRMEFALAVAAGSTLEGAAWRDGEGWAYRLGGADGGPDRFRARLDRQVDTTEEDR